MFDEHVIKWGFGIAISWYVIKELFKLLSLLLKDKHKTNNDRKEYKSIQDTINTKVSIDSCRSFKTRIGKESDEHRTHIIGIRDDISEIKAGVAYLKGCTQK